MYIRVNKNTGTRKTQVKYAALSAGANDGHAVWFDDESKLSPKRRNRILLTREKKEAIESDRFDA